MNDTWGLYLWQALFRTEFLCEFLSVLLGGLAEGGWRAMVRDEVTAAVHAMAAVDFNAFRLAFLPHFLRSLPGLAPQHLQQLEQFPPDTVSYLLLYIPLGLAYVYNDYKMHTLYLLSLLF